MFITMPIARKTNIVIQELNNEVLIYDLEANKAYCLNETSAEIWKLCDGSKSIIEITRAVSKTLDSKTNEDLVWLAIDQLKNENLLENVPKIEYSQKGLSRREAIRKVGLGTMVALPLISSLVAPTAAMAQSRRLAGVGQTCGNPNDCASCLNGNSVQCRNNAAVCPGAGKCCDCSS